MLVRFTFNSPTVSEVSILSLCTFLESERQRGHEYYYLNSQRQKVNVPQSPWFRCIWPMDSRGNDWSLKHAFGWGTMGRSWDSHLAWSQDPIRCMASVSKDGPKGDREGKGNTVTAYKFPLCLVPKNVSKSLGAWGLIIANISELDLSVPWEIYSALHDAATKDSTSKFDIWPNPYPPDHVDSLAKAKVNIPTICHLNRIAFIVFTWKGTYYTGIGVSLERPQCVGPPLLCLILFKAHSYPPPIPHPSLLNLHSLRVDVLMVRRQADL